MRKHFKLIILMLAVNMILTACSNSNKAENDIKTNDLVKNRAGAVDNTEDISQYTVKDYYPFKENTLYEYQGIGGEYADQKTFTEYISGDRAQIKISNPGLAIIKLLEHKDGELREIYTEGEFKHIEDKIDSKGKTSSVVLKEPLQVGNSWDTSDGRKRKITGKDIDIDVPYGKLKALEVTTELDNNRKLIDYYSLNIGHVASIYKDGEFEVKTLLAKIHKGPIKHKIRFFYPLEDGTGTIYKDKKIAFNTNDKLEDIMEEGMKNPENETLISLMSEKAQIRSIRLDRANNILRVDFNKQFLKDNMVIGSFLEDEVIQSIVNTLGRFYETNKVFISVEDKPYESGHMMLEEGEFFETTDDAIKIVD